MTLIRELGADDAHLALATMRELRPHLADDAGAFRDLLDRPFWPDGYRLVASVDDEAARLGYDITSFHFAHDARGPALTGRSTDR